MSHMGFPADQLSAGEEVVLEMHEHWKHLLGTMLVCVAALVGLVVVLAISPAEGFLAWLATLGWVAFAGVVLVFGVWPTLAWWYRTYTLTNERLATRKGVLRRSGRDIPLTRVNDVAFDQGILDRMVGAGTLRVSAASEEGTIVWVDIPDIHRVALRLNEQARAAREGRHADGT
jgi:membrane protein YdbS with pleckstrin-like domain